jgi:hypothetical protein
MFENGLLRRIFEPRRSERRLEHILRHIQIKECERGGACSMHGRYEEYM